MLCVYWNTTNRACVEYVEKINMFSDSHANDSFIIYI